jgi:hypothetical protein
MRMIGKRKRTSDGVAIALGGNGNDLNSRDAQSDKGDGKLHCRKRGWRRERLKDGGR